MENSYRNFNIYLNSVRKTITYVGEALPNFLVRLYVDPSVELEELKTFQDFPNVEIVLYLCKSFWDATSKRHKGVFGTFVRFLPLFSGSKIARTHFPILVSDIDVPMSHFMLLKELAETCPKNGSDMGFLSQMFPFSWAPQTNRFSILAGSMVSYTVFPRKTFYLDDLLAETAIAVPLKGRNTHVSHGILSYGIDEHFLNTKLYEMIVSNGLRVSCMERNNVARVLRSVYYKFLSNSEQSRLKQSLDKVDEVDHVIWYKPQKVSSEHLFRAVDAFVARLPPHVRSQIPPIQHREILRKYVLQF
jgi:hypothetical protein